MCGRFSLIATPGEIELIFGLAGLESFPPRYNIAPTQPVLIVTAGVPQEQGSNLPDRTSLLVRWGFTPAWVKDPREFPLIINARSETVMEKNSFRTAMRHRRMLIPASGFYEWKREGRRKAQPYWIRPKNGGVVAFAGLWETWEGREGSAVDTACILTTHASEALEHIHHRMPVVIQPEDFTRWLDCRSQEPRDVADLLVPADPDFFEAVPVSQKVNKVANSGPDIQEQLDLDEANDDKGDDAGDTATGQMSLF